jgi:hypothetical protein
MLGNHTSVFELTNVSKHGFWILLVDEELHLPFEYFPWFRSATIEQISAIVWPSETRLYWPMLDIDLSIESIRHPENFPLVSKFRK